MKIVKLWNSDVMIPEEMGTPNANQMLGSPSERICELSGRVCYDSLGAEKSRGSVDYHKHIAQVKHFSTIEHAWFTVLIERVNNTELLMSLVNRPQLQVGYVYDKVWRVTFNLRHIVEWSIQTNRSDSHTFIIDELGTLLYNKVQPSVPMILGDKKPINNDVRVGDLRIVDPITDNEKFVSVFMKGGRGFSHEQVRHRFAISQRSSRFCDESESEIIEHPLIGAYVKDTKDTSLDENRAYAIKYNQSLYRDGVNKLQQWLMGRGVDKLTARKQARGAMRNDLGNGLYTEMIVTANLTQWRHMFEMRCSQFADAEIRAIYCGLLPEFHKYGLFGDMSLIPSPDGIGEVLCLAHG